MNFHSIGIFCCAGVVLPFFLPNIISNLIKPVAIIVCLMIILKKQKWVINIELEHGCLLILCMMYSIALMRVLGTGGIVDAISYILYLLFTFISISCELNKKNIESFISLLYIATAIFSVCVAISNPLWSSNIYNRTYLNVLWIRMNSNQIAYVSLIGLALAPYMLDKKKTGKNYILHLTVTCILVYIILLTISRSAFLAFLAIGFIYLLSILKRCHGAKKILVFIFLCVSLVVAIIIAFKFLPKDQITRLLSKGAYSDSSGRIEMYVDAIKEVHNPFTGNGPGTYTGSGKIHNAIIKVYFETGIVGAVLITVLLCKLTFSAVHNYGRYLVIILLAQAMLESGDAYTFWVPVILLYHMSKGVKGQNLVKYRDITGVEQCGGTI